MKQSLVKVLITKVPDCCRKRLPYAIGRRHSSLSVICSVTRVSDPRLGARAVGQHRGAPGPICHGRARIAWAWRTSCGSAHALRRFLHIHSYSWTICIRLWILAGPLTSWARAWRPELGLAVGGLACDPPGRAGAPSWCGRPDGSQAEARGVLVRRSPPGGRLRRDACDAVWVGRREPLYQPTLLCPLL